MSISSENNNKIFKNAQQNFKYWFCLIGFLDTHTRERERERDDVIWQFRCHAFSDYPNRELASFEWERDNNWKREDWFCACLFFFFFFFFGTHFILCLCMSLVSLFVLIQLVSYKKIPIEPVFRIDAPCRCCSVLRAEMLCVPCDYWV